MKKISFMRAFVMVSQIALVAAIIYIMIAGNFWVALLDAVVLALNVNHCGVMGKDVDK